MAVSSKSFFLLRYASKTIRNLLTPSKAFSTRTRTDDFLVFYSLANWVNSLVRGFRLGIEIICPGNCLSTPLKPGSRCFLTYLGMKSGGASSLRMVKSWFLPSLVLLKKFTRFFLVEMMIFFLAWRFFEFFRGFYFPNRQRQLLFRGFFQRLA